MTLVIDTGPLVAIADEREPLRESVLAILRSEPGSLVLPAPVTAEVDYLLGQRFGPAARHAFLRDLAAGRFTVACLEQTDHAAVLALDQRYADLELGLVDCSVIVLAKRLATTRILTFDHRHLRAVTSIDGEPFTLLPADAETSLSSPSSATATSA